MQTNSGRWVRPFVVIVLGVICGSLTVLYPVNRTSPSPPVIAFVPRISGTGFTEEMHRGAQAAATSAGYQIYWNAPTREDDLDRQILISENAVRKGAKALVLGPTNVWGVTAMVDGLVTRRVPVVIVQSQLPMPAGQYLSSVTPDQSQFGTLAAERVLRVTGGSGQIAIVGLARGTPETLVRAQSFMRAIAAHPGISVVTQSPGSLKTVEAEQSVRETVKAFPQLKAIFAVSGDAAQGAMQALQDLDASHSIALVGCDRGLFLLDDLKRGNLDSLIVVDGYQVGFLAVKAAVAGAQGHPLPPPQAIQASLVTQKDMLRPVVNTRSANATPAM
jgi:ribose transport system substrate-binding protein